MKLKDSVAAVTGGAQGVGRGIVEALLDEGAKVCIADINKSNGEKTASELAKTYGGNVFFKQCDITKDADIRAVFEAVRDAFGTTVDILVNNAGIFREQDLSLCLAVNLEAQLRSTSAATDYMGVNNGGKGGVIIFTASIAGLLPFPGAPFYAASKFGVVGYVRSIGADPAYSKYGLRFNCICPSYVDTDLVTDESLRKNGDPLSSTSVIPTRDSTVLLAPRDIGIGCIKLIEDDTLNGKALVINRGDTGRGDATYTFAEPPTIHL